MMQLTTTSRCAVGWQVRYGLEGEERLILIARATSDIKPDGRLTAVAEEAKLSPIDLHHGEPGTSSIRSEADIGAAKPATDLVVVGQAVSRQGPVRMLPVEVDLAGILRSRMFVHGERAWRKRLIGSALAEAEPFTACPLMWELAAGGSDPEATPPSQDRRNPVGRGWRGKRSTIPRDGQPAPRITATPDDLETPVGWGCIAPHWLPRATYGGTYDQTWQEQRFPLLPKDFDPRFFQTAAPGLTAPGVLAGGERLRVTGCHADGDVTCALPRVVVTGTVELTRGEPLSCPLSLATVLIEPTDRRLRLLWRGEVVIHRRLDHIRAMRITAEGLP